MIKKSPLFSLAFALLLLAAPLASQQKTYSGTIDARGYTPPANTFVHWTRPKFPTVIKRLNPAIPWDGNPTSDAYFCRYAECDRAVLGMQIASQGVETRGSMSFLILEDLFRAAGVPVSLIDLQDITDFGIVHGGTRQLTCSDFTAYTGRPDPFCTEDLGQDKLRMQPTIPEGCCKNFLPCVVDAGKKPGTKWREQVATPQGGKRTCYMVQPAAPPVDPGPGGGVDPDPEPPPSEGGEDPPPVTKPEPEPKCWMLRVEPSGEAGLSAVPCPPLLL